MSGKKPRAFSYIRFSTPEQAKGDSLRRQTEKAEAYCHRRGWVLDESLTLRDLGVSAFKGKNAMVGNLRVFLDAVGRGTIPPGSALIVESIDRITRQGIDEGYDLIKGILKKGVLVVTLSPEREFGPEAVKSLSKGALEIQLILERAAEESERKSERIGASWAQKKKKARDGVLLSHRVPGWIQVKDGKLVLRPKAAKAVRRIFELAAGGKGIPTILRTLDREKVAPIGRNGEWNRAYLGLLLKDRRVLGEYQPKKDLGRHKDGAVIMNYYPPVVTQSQWEAARAGIFSRRKGKGRIGKCRVNVFNSILKHARDGDSYIMTTNYRRLARGLQKVNVLVNYRADMGIGGTRAYSIPYDVFETAVLSCFK